MAERVMLLEMGDESKIEEMVKGGNYLWEVKKDGARAIISTEAERLEGVGRERGFSIIGRSGEDFSGKFPELAALAKSLPQESCIDGEIFVPLHAKDKARPTTANRTNSGNGAFLSRLAPATFCAFDVIRWEGQALTERPIEERKQFLFDRLSGRPNCEVLMPLADPLAEWRRVVCENEEGLVAKLKGSRYQFARSYNWLKMKNWKTRDFKIVGITSEKRDISALALEGGFKVNFGVDKATYLKYLKLFRKTGKTFLANDNSFVFEIEPGFAAEVRYLNISESGIRFPILAKIDTIAESAN